MELFQVAVDKRRFIYLTGGHEAHDENKPSNKVSMLNLHTLEQRELPDLNLARYRHASLILNSYLFVMGGGTNSMDNLGSIESLSILE